jgi:hypothetical protein
MATARNDDPDRTVWFANDLAGTSSHDKHSPTVLLQIGRPSAYASDLGARLEKLGRRPLALVVKDRYHAQSDISAAKLAGACAVWVFTDDLFEAFMTLFATRLAFALRLKAKEGLPVVGIGSGALAVGGLLLANRICRDAQYDLVGGLGWAPRVLVDGGAGRAETDGAIARGAVRNLPGLLGLDLGVRGGVSVTGGRVESIGSEPIQLLGVGENGGLLMLSLEPGMVTTIAPAPFAPFDRSLLAPETLRTLTADRRSAQGGLVSAALRQVPLRSASQAHDNNHTADTHTLPGSGRRCPMCQQVHPAERKVELAV